MDERLAAVEKRLDSIELYIQAVDETVAEMVSIMTEFDQRQRYLAGVNVLGRFETVQMPKARANKKKENANRERAGSPNTNRNSNGNRPTNRNSNGNRPTSGNGNGNRNRNRNRNE
jgi:hypothetical protein